ncbi:hypothetical protein [Myroides pelagicus]|uniref:Uncharacterized protein n=1 Tax=Myroides pelagicus TaxID=270914 RepID=A0A7K1GM49_9FLAO|nr:hypothetical protein [Myroides pelagicus]MEC4113067.1 hypothetical protein [Myroides pelagicus]MTH29972.1 hypothetical protein [Myroides pelagicus]
MQCTLKDISTEDWNTILTFLRKNKWTVIKQYPLLAFDKGIDQDYYHLKKENTIIKMDWCNWFEGEITADSLIIEWLLSELKFTYLSS